MNFHVPGPDEGQQTGQLAPQGHQYQGTPVTHSAQFKHFTGPPIDPNLGPGITSNINPPGPAQLAPRGDSMPPPYFTDGSRSAITPSTPSRSLSPRHAIRSPSQPRQSLPPFIPADRPLPSRDVNDETIDDIYAQFILHCNPTFPLTVDTTELRKIFRQPPKSDGKSFSIWHLYELVKKYEEKEIKTWVELALELGVEKPALDKGQSTQKVQQYSVRLKRWMRAMHVDAFFDFLRGAPKEYYTHIPPPHDPHPEGGRDGVPAEEDLALRALDPSMRPKRGRRKADEMDDDEPRGATPEPNKRVESAVESSPYSFAVPQSAYPPNEYGQEHDPWAAASAITPVSFLPPQSAKGLTPHSANPSGMLRWRVSGPSNTPITPHPLSAVTPASAHPGWDEEPQSAVTPRGKSRRRHGPLVSSAWSSTASTANGKLRGRPPSNRTVRDGPYSTFPVNPSAKEPALMDINPTPVTAATPSIAFPPPLNTNSLPTHRDVLTESPVPQSSTSTQPPSSAKRERLQLQVPKRHSGPVQLITPPTTGPAATPTVLVNGKNAAGAEEDSPLPRRGSVFFGEEASDGGVPPYDAHLQQANASPAAMRAASSGATAQATENGPSQRPATPHTEDLKRALAHDLLRATLSGRKRKRLRGHEAKGLASAILSRMASTDIIQAAAWLGVSSDLGLGGSGAPKPVAEGKKIDCHRFRVGEDGYDSPIDEDDDEPMNGDDTNHSKYRIREMFDVTWSLSLGGLAGDFQLKGLAIAADDDANGGGSKKPDGLPNGVPSTDADWRQKWEKTHLELQEKEEEVRKLRDKILDAVL